MRPALPALLAFALCSCVTMHTTTMAREPESAVMQVASVQGKYQELLLTFEAPEDSGQYGEKFDYGWWDGHQYKGVEVPPGYWVYVYPVWYVWQRQAETPR